MIQSVITHRCTKCNSIDVVKNGTDYKGDQKFHCHTCGAHGTLNHRAVLILPASRHWCCERIENGPVCAASSASLV